MDDSLTGRYRPTLVLRFLRASVPASVALSSHTLAYAQLGRAGGGRVIAMIKPWPARHWLVDLSCVINATVAESLPHFSPPLPPPLALSEAVFQRGYLLLTERRGLTQPLISSAYRCSDRLAKGLLTHTPCHTYLLFSSIHPVQDLCTFTTIGVELFGKWFVLFMFGSQNSQYSNAGLHQRD